MARLQVIPDEDMEAREFFYHGDMIRKDIQEEEKRNRMREAMGRANGVKFY